MYLKTHIHFPCLVILTVQQYNKRKPHCTNYRILSILKIKTVYDFFITLRNRKLDFDINTCMIIIIVKSEWYNIRGRQNNHLVNLVSTFFISSLLFIECIYRSLLTSWYLHLLFLTTRTTYGFLIILLIIAVLVLAFSAILMFFLTYCIFFTVELLPSSTLETRQIFNPKEVK